MQDFFIQLLAGFSHEISTVLLAALPITELRGAIPLAIVEWNLAPMEAYFLAVVGNLLPLIPLYFGLDWFKQKITQIFPQVGKMLDHRIQKSGDRVRAKYEVYGAVALFFFTAIPLPLTGLYTATFAAVALKIPFVPAAKSIFLGVTTAGIIVIILTVGIQGLF